MEFLNTKSLVAQTLSLENIHQAQSEFQEKKHFGKLALTVK